MAKASFGIPTQTTQLIGSREIDLGIRVHARGRAYIVDEQKAKIGCYVYNIGRIHGLINLC